MSPTEIERLLGRETTVTVEHGDSVIFDPDPSSVEVGSVRVRELSPDDEKLYRRTKFTVRIYDAVSIADDDRDESADGGDVAEDEKVVITSDGLETRSG